MKSWKKIFMIILGAVLFLGGGYAALISYSFPILPGLTVTTWRDVIIFSILSLAGIIMIIFTLKKSTSIKQQSS